MRRASKHSEWFINEDMDRNRTVSSMSMEAEGKGMTILIKMEGELKKAIAMLECTKAARSDKITPRILKYGGDAIEEKMCLVCDCMETRNTSLMEEGSYCLHKGIGNKNNCSNFRRISLFSVPGKVYTYRWGGGGRLKRS